MSETDTEEDSITREVTVDAPLEDVWEAVSTDEGRNRWLEEDADRVLVVETTQAPTHISWWWWRESDGEPARHVDVQIAPAPDGTRVEITETLPAILPVASALAASFQPVCA